MFLRGGIVIRLISIGALVAGLCAQTSPFPRTLDVWRAIRRALIDDPADTYFRQIEGAEIPGQRRMFDGTVVSKASANKLIVSVDDAAGDAILICDQMPEDIQSGSHVQFEGVVKSYTRNPYRLTLEYARVIQPRSRVAGNSRRATRPDEFFADPEALCKALQGKGIQPGPWKPVGDSAHAPFDCEYAVDGTIFRISGDYKWRADIISLAITVHNQSEWPAAQEKLGSLVAAIFKFIGKPEPAGLLRAIKTRRYYLARRSYGVVWFNFVAPMEPSRRRTFWFRLSE